MKEKKRNLAMKHVRTKSKGATLVILAVLVMLPVTASAADIPNDYNFGMGPAVVRTQGPGQSLRMASMGIVPGSIPPGFTVVTAFSQSSIWGNNDDILLDFAILDNRVAFTYGLSDRLGFGIAFNERRFIGGNLDQITLTTHKILGQDQNGRDKVDKYDHRIVRYAGDGSTVIFETREMEQFNNAGISLAGHYVLTYGSDGFMPAVGLTGIVNYATEAPPGNEDNPLDWTVGTGFSKRLSETWNLYGYLNYTKYELTEITPSGSSLTPLDMADSSVNLMLAGGWQWRENWATIFQYLRSEGVTEGFGEFDDASNEIDIAFRWQAGQRDVLEFTMIENFAIHDNSPDFGLQVAYAHHFGD
jgi:hypothetical protein